MAYKQLYAIPTKSFEDYLNSRTNNFSNVKNLSVDQLNINEAEKINSNLNSKIQADKKLETINEDEDKLVLGGKNASSNLQVENERIRKEFYPNQSSAHDHKDPEKTQNLHRQRMSTPMREKGHDWSQQRRGIEALYEWAEEDPFRSYDPRQYAHAEAIRPQQAEQVAKVEPVKEEEDIVEIPVRRGEAIAQAARNMANLQNQRQFGLHNAVGDDIQTRVDQLNRPRN